VISTIERTNRWCVDDKGGGIVTRIISWKKKLMLLGALLAMLIVAAVPATAQIDQEGEQESESGEVNQTFEVSSTGDNSNQCANVQGVANTGNAQNQIDLIQYGSEADDFEFDEVGSSIEVSPENSTTCDQQVNQAASASGDSPGTGGTPVKKKYEGRGRARSKHKGRGLTAPALLMPIGFPGTLVSGNLSIAAVHGA
jgi:hypothetical protein